MIEFSKLLQNDNFIDDNKTEIWKTYESNVMNIWNILYELCRDQNYSNTKENCFVFVLNAIGTSRVFQCNTNE